MRGGEEEEEEEGRAELVVLRALLGRWSAIVLFVSSQSSFWRAISSPCTPTLTARPFPTSRAAASHDGAWAAPEHAALVGRAGGPGAAELLVERRGPVDCCGGGGGRGGEGGTRRAQHEGSGRGR